MRFLTTVILFSVVGTIAIAEPTSEQVDLAANEHDQANIAMMKKDDEEAYSHLQKAVELDPTNSTFLNSTAYMAMKMGDPSKAIEYLDMALILDQERFGADHPNVASVINNKASVYSSMGNYAKAATLYQQAYDIVVKAVGEKHPQAAIIKRLLDAEKVK